MHARLIRTSIARAATAPLCAAYASALAHKNRRFDRGIGVARLPVPVISVGNLSVGGTGKTPVVSAIVETLSGWGLRPCIAMRGYAPQGGVSDEAVQHRERFPTVPVVAQPDRLSGLHSLMASEPGRVGCVVLDDGFQHRQIARDLDIVLIDATRPPHEARLLPAGRLREPVESLRRAHIAVLTRCEQVQEDRRAEVTQHIARQTPSVIQVRSTWIGLSVSEGGADTDQALSAARGRAILLVSAIGNPRAFESVARAEFGESPALRFRDHDPYGPSAIQRIASAIHEHRAELVLTTEKDWVKLRRHAPKLGVPVARPRLDIEFLQGGDEFWSALERTARGTPGHGKSHE